MKYEDDQIKLNEMDKIYGSERGHKKYLKKLKLLLLQDEGN